MQRRFTLGFSVTRMACRKDELDDSAASIVENHSVRSRYLACNRGALWAAYLQAQTSNGPSALRRP